jgi:hypothetical protein
MCNTSKKSSEELSYNFQIIYEVFFLKKIKKETLFYFFDTKNFFVFVFTKQLKDMGKKYFLGASWDNN